MVYGTITALTRNFCEKLLQLGSWLALGTLLDVERIRSGPDRISAASAPSGVSRHRSPAKQGMLGECLLIRKCFSHC